MDGNSPLPRGRCPYLTSVDGQTTGYNQRNAFRKFAERGTRHRMEEFEQVCDLGICKFRWLVELTGERRQHLAEARVLYALAMNLRERAGLPLEPDPKNHGEPLDYFNRLVELYGKTNKEIHARLIRKLPALLKEVDKNRMDPQKFWDSTDEALTEIRDLVFDYVIPKLATSPSEEHMLFEKAGHELGTLCQLVEKLRRNSPLPKKDE